MMKRLAPIMLVALWPAAATAQPAPSPSGATAPAPPTAAPPAAPPPPASLPAGQGPSEAQIAPHIWNVDQVRCSDLLHASDEDREAAAMFYYGYLAAKSGIHVINTGRISDNIAKVIKECTATPALAVPQAFRRALGHSPPRG
jgi:HdeA/HdeB family